MAKEFNAETITIDGRVYMDAATVGRFLKALEKQFEFKLGDETKEFFKYVKRVNKEKDEEFED